MKNPNRMWRWFDDSPKEEVGQPVALCTKCGGLFDSEKLQRVSIGTVYLMPEGGLATSPTFTQILYCQNCTPTANLVLVLRSLDGERADERYFTLDEGWFQDIDKETGDPQYVVSLEQYSVIWCTKCGDAIEETTCKKHNAPEPKPRKR